MKILLTVEYDGKNYCGWQIQHGETSVQGTLKSALEDLLGCNVVLHASGRTDAGVHALGQKAHFRYDGTFPVERIPLAVNTRLPSDIRVQKAEICPDDFHAQFDAKRKTYSYRFYLSRTGHPLLDSYATQVPYGVEKFNYAIAAAAAEDLVGEHDFIGFSSTGRPVLNSVRTIYAASLSIKGETAELLLTGNGFLYNMVRIIAGTIVKIGLGQLPPTAVRDVLATGERTKAGTTFPPQGLTLVSVEYGSST